MAYPERDLVIVVFAGNYNEPDDWKLSVQVIEDFIAPALEAKREEK